MPNAGRKTDDAYATATAPQPDDADRARVGPRGLQPTGEPIMAFEREVYDMHVALEAIRHKFQNQLPADVFHETEPYFLPESLLKSPPRPDRFSDPRRPAGTSSSPFSKRSSKSSSS